MIINLLTQVPNIIKCSYYDYLNSSILSDSYSLKNLSDILSWKIVNDTIRSTTFTIISDKTRSLKEIQFNIIGGSSIANFRIFTSLDYCNWYELDKFYYNGYYFIKINGEYINYDNSLTDPSKLIGIDTNAKYIFKKLNKFNNLEEYIYNNLEFKYIKIVVDGFSASVNNPVYASYFNIYVDDTFDANEMNMDVLKNKSGMFTMSKAYEDETFIPNCIQKYMGLLEDKNPDQYTNLLTSNIYFGDFISHQR